MAVEYNSEGRLPIHEAAFRNYDDVVERILSNLNPAKSLLENEDIDDNRSEEEKEKHEFIFRSRVQEMIEITTNDYFRLTPLLAATVGNARRTIEILIKYGAKLTCRDADNRSIAAITVLKQNIDLFLYFSQTFYAQELDLWNTLINMFISKTIEDPAAAGRMLEQLTSSKYILTAWSQLSPLRIVEKVVVVLVHTVNNDTNDQLLTSCLLILNNLMRIDSSVKHTFGQNENGARALVKMPKSTENLLFLFARVICQLCDDTRCIHAFVSQGLVNEIQAILNTDLEKISSSQACSYFEILSKIARCKSDYQSIIQGQSIGSNNLSIVEQAIELLERFDRQLTIAILHFIRDLCVQNEEQQQICADNRYLIAHLLSSLNSSYRDIQRASVDTLQMIVSHNPVSQLNILQQGGAEQLLTLLRKATLARLRISIVCTLWSLTGYEPHRRQSMASAIGVSTLVEFLNLKSPEQLFIVIDAISELVRRVPTIRENIPVLFGRRHCIPSLVRLLIMDSEPKLLIKCLCTVQQLCLLATFRPCRSNQTIFQKAIGLHQLLTLVRKARQDNKLIQAKAITTLACAIFAHKENKEMLTKTVIEQMFLRISTLLRSPDEDIQIEAGTGLAIFVCNDVNNYNLCSETISINLEHFRRLLNSNNVTVRCNAAFQLIILIRLIPNVDATLWIGQALMTLFRVIADPHMTDEEKILPTDIIGRFARIPTGFGRYKHTGVCEAIIASDGLEHLMALLNSSNSLLHATAAVAIDCLVRHSPEGQRRLLKQCRYKSSWIDIFLLYLFEPSPWLSKINELYASINHTPVYFPPIQRARRHKRVPIS